MKKHDLSTLDYRFIDDGLSLAYRTLDEIPQSLVESIDVRLCRRIDLTECLIRNLGNLKYFPCLEVLVLDKNEIESLYSLPYLPTLHTLWCNNNNITSLPAFLDDVNQKCPNVTYLSIMRNPACPELLDITNPDHESIRLYRSYVIFRIPRLKILDSSPVTERERQNARLRGQYAFKKTLGQSSSLISEPTSKVDKIEFLRVSDVTASNICHAPGDLLDPSNLKEARSHGQGKIGRLKSRHKFDSKHSEGNRFISDQHL